jgi:hypothetical protein
MIADLTLALTNEEFATAVDELEYLTRLTSKCEPETYQLLAALQRIVDNRRGPVYRIERMAGLHPLSSNDPAMGGPRR